MDRLIWGQITNWRLPRHIPCEYNLNGHMDRMIWSLDVILMVIATCPRPQTTKLNYLVFYFQIKTFHFFLNISIELL